MFEKYPVMSRFLIFIIIPLFLILFAVYWHVAKGVVDSDTDVVVKGISHPVKIRRDNNGVVYIDTQTDTDAFFAIGYAHAQDRLWQLELQRRIAAGTMSEVFGKALLSKDTWMRTLDFYGAAESAYEAIDEDAKASLQAYADGINAWLNSNPVLPPEFLILGVTPAPWKPIDSLAWAKVFALNISANLDQEINNLITNKYLSPDQQAFLNKGYPENAPVSITELSPETEAALLSLGKVNKEMETDLGIGGQNAGSNAWVVSGKYTESGAAILANDPHLGLQMPSLWYVASLKGDRLNTSGMTLVGMPVVVFGRNESIAWGGTAMLADVQDLYFEQVNAKNSKQYLFNGEWLEFETRTEEISIKADFPAELMSPYQPVKIILRKSRHGPLVTDMNGVFDQPVSLRWTALNENDTTYQSFFQMNYAQDWTAFQKAASFLVTPALNMLYADSKNNIGYLAAGKIPVRANGEGQLPVPGWTDEFAWNGYIPDEVMPRTFNPKKGFIVSANNKIIGDEYPYFISKDWAEPARAQRIEELLEQQIEGEQAVDLAFIQSMHADTKDVSALALVPVLLSLEPENDKQKQVIALIRDWDGQMSEDSVAASIFYVWVKHLRMHLFDDQLDGFWNKITESDRLLDIGRGTSNSQLYKALTSNELDWCENVGTAVKENCKTMLQQSLKAALEELEELKGGSFSNWNWGNLHFTLYKHTPFSDFRFLDMVFGRQLENGGSSNTVNVANARWLEGEGYQQTFGATFRQIMQMGDGDIRHLYMNSTGQSGHVLSKHYSDMVKPFNRVEFFELYGDGNKNVETTTILNPTTN
ncbi:penicillin acylase family protein [Paraneptunicella aestuarii]|uniref:penicillin acylase family protein n=1 Tax=Paraneptunicella aestuarii TaxID=2831148 RepID=UPI001E2F0853|nr:penicillin acylase family protein [Paraneptunicella aestuarii]UAA37221.1 penicillin acylase family protein [Paraneptunicella aestuarii]